MNSLTENISIQKQPRFFLKKDDRLKSRKEIQLLFAEGSSFSNFPFRIVKKITAGDEGLKAGFSVSKSIFKKASDRNRVKRIMREAYRLQKNELAELVSGQQKTVALFFIYTSKELPAFDVVYEKTGNVLKRIIKQLNANAE